MNWLQAIFGSRNERILKGYRKDVITINNLEAEISQLTSEQLMAKTQEFKQRHQQGESLDKLLPECFATVREAAKRVLNMRHFDVQLIGGMVLHSGKIAEMKTGEGKTLVATLPAYLNAISGRGVHIVTTNDYLAKRDAEWMQPIYMSLGLTVGVVMHGMEGADKQAAYAADIAYGTNNEFGFDYLRDNMAFSAKERMQGELNFAIVDEVDSILIDEARTPLIISGADEDSTELYLKINKIIPDLTKQDKKDGPGDFSIDEKSRQAFLTENGHAKVEKLLVKQGILQEGASLYDASNIMYMHHIQAGLKAHAIFKRDVDYIVSNDQVVIVDEHTGRTMEGRRWSDGIHQAVEAKEGVEIQSENQTLASITFQNYFRLYNKLAGMTGTADTEAFEFQQIYKLEVVIIPTNVNCKRLDHADCIFLTQEEKFTAILEDIQHCHNQQQPVLVGTISIETSEFLGDLLQKANIPHNVLNAKYHAQEAEIIAEAGRPGAVTIATNMAGRGTDIVLGGSYDAAKESRDPWQARHDQVIAAGGLHILGTERHESRRIDNQLRGRCGRQGDPGSSRFYLSVQDNLMRIFVSEKIAALLNKLGMDKGEAITHSWVNRSIENAQRKVEGHNFDVRKQLLEFDDVANDQRKVIYQQRNELMETDDIAVNIKVIMADTIESVISEFMPPESLEEQWQIQELMLCLENDFGLKLSLDKWLETEGDLHEEGLRQRIIDEFNKTYQTKEQEVTSPVLRNVEKTIMLNVLDSQWKDHLATMDHLRQSIHLRGYAQKDPKQEYKREAFGMFTAMLEGLKREITQLLMRVQISSENDVAALNEQWQNNAEVEYQHDSAASVLAPAPAAFTATGSNQPKIGRNAPCPCGSGKKYKQCHGKL